MTESPSSLSCPRCVSTLHAVDTDDGPTLDFCAACGGIWFDHGELESFLSWKTPPERQAAAAELVACPRCQTDTLAGFRLRGEGPLLEACRTCGGVWCDQGEVAALKSFSPAARTTTIDGNIVPLLQTEGARGAPIDWKWIVIGFLLMMTMLGVASVVINIWIASDLVIDAERRVSPDTLMMVGGGLSFAISGFIVGWRSTAYTLWEPAIVAVPAALAFPLFFTQQFTMVELLMASAGAFLITMLSALAGERMV